MPEIKQNSVNSRNKKYIMYFNGPRDFEHKVDMLMLHYKAAQERKMERLKAAGIPFKPAGKTGVIVNYADFPEGTNIREILRDEIFESKKEELFAGIGIFENPDYVEPVKGAQS